MLSGSFPPPGGPTGTPPPPGGGPPAGGPPPGPGAFPPPPGPSGPTWSGAAHKPGAVPLRPLGLGDIYDAAFRIIRFNPGATVGSAVLVAAVAMVIPVVVTSLLATTYDLTASIFEPGATPSEGDFVGFFAAMGSLLLGGILQSIGLILVTGMVAHVTMAAALGRRLTLGQAWTATRGQRWRLIGLTFLLALLLMLFFGVYAALWALMVLAADTAGLIGFGLVTVPLFVALLWLFWIRIYYLAVPALMLEDLRVTEAIGRGRELTARAFWRTFGIALLTVVITNVAAALLGAPVTLVSEALSRLGGVAPDSVMMVVLGNAVSSVVAAAFVAPFATAVTCLQYLDQRIRKEGYDVELVTAAGLPRP